MLVRIDEIMMEEKYPELFKLIYPISIELDVEKSAVVIAIFQFIIHWKKTDGLERARLRTEGEAKLPIIKSAQLILVVKDKMTEKGFFGKIKIKPEYRESVKKIRKIEHYRFV